MKAKMHDKEILLIEDNKADAQVAMHFFNRSGKAKRVRHVANAQEALHSLKQPGMNGLPALILFDLSPGEAEDLYVLDQIKSDPKLRHIPVVVMTNSENREEILKTYQHSANSVFPKPADLNDYLRELENLEDYWLDAARLP